jgi:hypothetical protein
MDRARGAAPAIRRAGSVALIPALLGMAGCTSSSSSPGAGSSPGPASASPGLSVPGTHKATARYQITAPVSTVVIVSHVGNVTVTAGAGSVRLTGLAGSLTAKADVGLIKATGLTSASVSLTTRVGGISATFTAPPTAVRASATVGAITVHVPGTTSYKIAADARVGKTTVSAPQSASSGHTITATTDVGATVVAPST